MISRTAAFNGRVGLNYDVGSWGENKCEEININSHLSSQCLVCETVADLLPLEPCPSFEVRPMRLERCVCTRGMN